MLSQSLQYLQLKPEEFNLQQVLLSLCKKNTILSESPEIDFLDFQEKLKIINQFHERTCEQIVEFVDTNCGEYIQINGKFQYLQQKIQKAENIIKLVNIKVKDYAKIYYQDQAKIQSIITKYQTTIVEKLLLIKCKEETSFLSQFVLLFESIISKSMDNLAFKERALLIRFCYKFKYLQSLFNHHILHQTLPEYIKIYQILMNLVEEVEFYISEQLSKLIKYKNKQNDEKQNKNDPKLVALNQIKLCYKYLNKVSEYYKNIQQNLIGRQMQNCEKNLISNKINLIGGKNIQVVQEYFKSIFSCIKQFPKSYPRKRLLQLIHSQLKKTEVKFLYTFALPIFPISYNCYMKLVNSLDQCQTELKFSLKQNHNWDLKRWIDVRQKNILDRCTKDWQSSKQKQNDKSKIPELNKWIDIIFKENCKIDGVKTQIAKLGIKVVTKYTKHIQKSDNFQPQTINKYIQIYNNIQTSIKQKLLFFFADESVNEDKQKSSEELGHSKSEKIITISNKLSASCTKTLEQSINSIIQSNTKLLSKTCSGCLEPYKSFIIKIIKSSKQITQHGVINLRNVLFKPLNSYIQNNETLSENSVIWIREVVVKNVMKYYDQVYVSEVYQYSRTNLSVEQLAQIMEVIGKERNMLFVDAAKN